MRRSSRKDRPHLRRHYVTARRQKSAQRQTRSSNSTKSTAHLGSIFVASRPRLPPFVSRSVSFFPPGYLRLREGTCPKPVRTIKGVLRKPLGLFQKVSAAAFQCVRDILFAESTEVGDLAVLTLLLKWPPAGLPFTGLWWNPVLPFIATCALQIFKLGLHKQCCAGEMIPLSEPTCCIINLCSIGQMLPSQTHCKLFIVLMSCVCTTGLQLSCKCYLGTIIRC